MLSKRSSWKIHISVSRLDFLGCSVLFFRWGSLSTQQRVGAINVSDAGAIHNGFQWGKTVFQIASRIGKDDPLVPWQTCFLALGRVVCTEYHVMIEAHIVNQHFQKAGVSIDPEKSYFPHMTLGKLEYCSCIFTKNFMSYVQFNQHACPSCDEKKPKQTNSGSAAICFGSCFEGTHRNKLVRPTA